MSPIAISSASRGRTSYTCGSSPSFMILRTSATSPARFRTRSAIIVVVQTTVRPGSAAARPSWLAGVVAARQPASANNPQHPSNIGGTNGQPLNCNMGLGAPLTVILRTTHSFFNIKKIIFALSKSAFRQHPHNRARYAPPGRSDCCIRQPVRGVARVGGGRSVPLEKRHSARRRMTIKTGSNNALR